MCIRDRTNIVFEPGIRTITSTLLLVLCGLLYYETLDASFMQNKLQTVSNKDLFAYPSVPSITINQFGVLGFGFLDIKSTMVEAPTKDTFVISESNNTTTDEDKRREIDDTILDDIIKNETDVTKNNINEYIKNRYGLALDMDTNIIRFRVEEEVFGMKGYVGVDIKTGLSMYRSTKNDR